MAYKPKFSPGDTVRHANGFVYPVEKVTRMFVVLTTTDGPYWARKREVQPFTNAPEA